MNPRQRRGVILLVVAALGAIAVFVSVLSFVSSVNARAGDFTSIVVLSRDVKAYEAIGPEDVELREIPQKWMSDTAIQDARDVVGLVPTTNTKAGTYAQSGMFVPRPGIADGHREIAVMVDAETGVAGKVKSGDRVDIIATFEQKDQGSRATSQLWAQDVLVIDVGLPETVKKESDDGGFSEGKAIPVTFALSTKDALRVAYAESFSVKVRLALRAQQDESSVGGGDQVFPQTSEEPQAPSSPAPRPTTAPAKPKPSSAPSKTSGGS
ncbi:Flp pilus assembly protein CpaB [Luteipulveratus halotolerans]|uniref:Flp pilus assembly protein CpaB n=1 Tax=Luteipulveratus halotolerans TaxID=1631356 RepID=UPI00068072E5|nr:Flp pilus assembly protein CpaB [Luteipulveratus halotolerans]